MDLNITSFLLSLPGAHRPDALGGVRINCPTSVSQFVRGHERATTRPVLRPAVVTAAHPALRYVEARAAFGDLLSVEAPVP